MAEAPTEHVFCIGGAGLFLAALPFATTLEMTLIHADIPGDVYMPQIDWDEWTVIAEEFHPADHRHAYPFTFRTLERINRMPYQEELAS